MKRDKKPLFVCTQCGNTSSKWMGRCSGCGGWNTMVEESADAGPAGRRGPAPEPIPLSKVRVVEEQRVPTGIGEMDRVLGGGLVPGALVLMAGEPGIGKSTLLLQVMLRLSPHIGPVLYVTGEESAAQIKMRAERLGFPLGERGPEPMVASETSMQHIEEMVRLLRPRVLAVDSVQTIFCPGIPSAPGSVAQVRESTARLMELTKSRELSTFLVGHVTKEGVIAGPRLLEHLVDTVLYFEGERSHAFRLLRTVKNRYGPTSEIGVFEMTEKGLSQVPNPSEIFMAQRPCDKPGSVVVPCMEGSRPILAEIQALVSPSHLTMPRRTATGVDGNRLALLIAVMERHLGTALYDRDIFLNVTGGLRISEPGADLAIVMAIISSFNDRALDPEMAVIGEVGLTGEVRAVGRLDLRLKEVARLGLARCMLPASARGRVKPPRGLEGVYVESVRHAAGCILQGRQG